MTTTDERVSKLEEGFEGQRTSLLDLKQGMVSVHTVLTLQQSRLESMEKGFAALVDVIERLEKMIRTTHPHRNGDREEDADDRTDT